MYAIVVCDIVFCCLSLIGVFMSFVFFFFFFKQKTAYEMRISDWSSDVCSSDLVSVGSGADLDMDALMLNAAWRQNSGTIHPYVALGAGVVRDRKSVV